MICESLRGRLKVLPKVTQAPAAQLAALRDRDSRKRQWLVDRRRP